MTDGDSDRPFARARYTSPPVYHHLGVLPLVGFRGQPVAVTVMAGVWSEAYVPGWGGANVVHSTAVVIG